MSSDTDRQRRLAEALRANLRRRKGQARERSEAEDAGEMPGDCEPQKIPWNAPD